MIVAHHPVKDAHIAALADVYPRVFGTPRITSVDITPKTSPRAYLYKLRYRGDWGITSTTVYEKFRSPDYAHYRSITLTHIDENGTLSDQLHDNPAQLTTQGFYNNATGIFAGPLVVVSLPDVIYRIQTGKLPVKLRNRPRSVCTYVEVLIDDLAPYALYLKEY